MTVSNDDLQERAERFVKLYPMWASDLYGYCLRQREEAHDNDYIQRAARQLGMSPEFLEAIRGAWIDEMRDAIEREHSSFQNLGVQG